MAQSDIVVVTDGGPHIWAIVNALQDRLGPVTVIMEEPESKRRLLQQARPQAWLVSAAGQLGTMVFTRLRKRFSRCRAATSLAGDGLKLEPAAGQAIVQGRLGQFARNLSTALAKLQPQVVLLAGCRLLSQRRSTASPARCSTTMPASRRNTAA